MQTFGVRSFDGLAKGPVLVLAPGLSEADILEMVLPDITAMDEQHHSSTPTVSKFRRTPAVASLDQVYDKSKFTFDDDLAYSDESTLTSAVDRNLITIMRRVQSGKGRDTSIGGSRRTLVRGLPDRVIQESGNVIGVIEVKTPRVLHSLDLVQDYKDNAASFAQDQISTNSCLYQVEQLCGYLSVNSLQFGVLTTCFSYFFEEARAQPTEPPIPRSISLSPPRPTSPENDDDSDDNTYRPSRYIGKQYFHCSPNIQQQGDGDNKEWIQRRLVLRGLSTGLDVTVGDIDLADFDFQGLLGEGRTGRVFKALWHQQVVAAKICDLFRHPEFLEDVLSELAVYNTLSSLQGSSIPQLLCAGFSSGHFLLGTGLAGSPVDMHKIDREIQLLAVEALSRIHQYEILHGDIRYDNVMTLKNGNHTQVYFIDFAMSRRTSDQQQLRMEMQKLKKLLDISPTQIE
ncbi:MAG: hypothetical protein J3Q66DRAFT_386968 [Benniella sp.]|nr:MAG: hypothetical protein J3Q66DRAFT_386968 [Benniella sp.]